MHLVDHQATLAATLVLALGGAMGGGCSPRLRPSLPRIQVASLQRTLSAAGSLRHRYGQHPAVFLRIYDRIVQEAREKHGMMRLLRVRRYVILDPRSVAYTTFTLTTRPGQRLILVDLAMVTPGGKAYRFGRKDLVVERHAQGRLVHKLVYPDVRVGAVIEERTELVVPHEARHGSLLRTHGVLLQRDVPVMDMELDYYVPRSWSVLHKPSSRAVERRLSRLYPRSGYLQYHYRRRDVPALTTEPFAPAALRDADSLRFQIHRMFLGGTWSGYQADWRVIGRAMGAVLLAADAPLERALQHHAERLFLGRGSPRERVRKVLDFTQTGLHVAPDSISSDSLLEVLRDGFGSRQQITAVAYHLLRVARVPAELLLAHDGRDAPFDRDFVSIHEIDEPALYVRLDGRGQVVIPWERAWPIDIAPPHLQGQWAMRVSPRGLVGWLRIPVASQGAAERVATYDVKVVGRDLLVSLREVYRGLKGASLRAALLVQDPKTRLRGLRERLRTHGRQVAVRRIRIARLDAPEEPLQVDSDFVLPGAVLHTPEGRLLRFSTGRVDSAQGLTRRERPLWLPQQRRDVEVVTLRFPRSWKLAAWPQSRTLRTVFGAATRKALPTAGRLWLHQSLLLRRTWQPPSNAGELARLFVAADDFSNVTVAFVLPGGPRPSPILEPPPASPPVPRAVPPPAPRAAPSPASPPVPRAAPPPAPRARPRARPVPARRPPVPPPRIPERSRPREVPLPPMPR